MFLSEFRGKLIVLTGIILVALTLRSAVTALTPLISSINADIPISATTTGILGLLPTASFAIFGFLTPYIIKRLGLIKTLLAALILTALGEISRIFTNDIKVFIVFSIIALAGMGAGNVLLPPLVKEYFPDKVGLVTSIYVTGISLGTAFPPFLAVSLSETFNWRFSLGSWSAIAIFATIPWITILITKPKTTQKPIKTPQKHLPAWKSPVAWSLVCMFSMTALTTYSMFTWLPQILSEAGINTQNSSLLLSLYAILGLPTTLIVPYLASKMKNPFPLVVFFVSCFCVGFLGLMLMPQQLTVLWIIFSGLAPGTFPLSLILINLRTKTHQGAGALSGFAQGVGYAIASTGPLVFGILHEKTGSWNGSFLFLLSSLLIMLIGGFNICKPNMFEDSIKPPKI